MLEEDLTAGLALPVELLVREGSKEDGGGTDLVYELPSALIAGIDKDETLLAAARKLDGYLREFMLFVGG